MKTRLAVDLAFFSMMLSVAFAVTSVQAASCESWTFSSYEDRVNQAYVAYYGRASDPAGLAYWADRLEGEGGSLDSIIQAFGASLEFNERFGQLSNAQLIRNIYHQLFNRNPDSAGAAFYTERLDSGSMTLQTIALNILDGAQGEDLLILGNKLQVSGFQTHQMDQGAIGDWSGDTLAGLLSGVDADPETRDTTCDVPAFTVIELEGGGQLAFYDAGLDPDAEISVFTDPAPTLTEDLEPVGDAYAITVDPEVTLPVQITLPVPAGYDGDEMALVRVETNGRITLLQTKAENGQLKAMTPGFSTFVTARLINALQRYRAAIEISGPAFIPINKQVPYQETGSSIEFQDLDRIWNVRELSPLVPMMAEVLPEGDSGDERALLFAENAGTLLLTVEFTEPTTGIKVFASKERPTAGPDGRKSRFGSSARRNCASYSSTTINLIRLVTV